MTDSRIPAEHLLALYDYYKDRRAACKEEAYKVLGGKCSVCGSTDFLRHRFVNPRDPQAKRYRTNPVTLFRRICAEPELRKDIYLICRECRIARRGATLRNEGDSIPGHKPLEESSTKGETDGYSR